MIQHRAPDEFLLTSPSPTSPGSPTASGGWTSRSKRSAWGSARWRSRASLAGPGRTPRPGRDGAALLRADVRHHRRPAGDGEPHRLHRRPGLRDLGRNAGRHRGVGCRLGRRRRPRGAALRHGCPVHAADRGRAAAAGGGLRLEPLRLQRRPSVHPAGAWVGLDVQGAGGRRSAIHRAEGARARACREELALADGGPGGRLAGLRPRLLGGRPHPPKDHRPVHEDWMVYDADRSRVGYATSIMYSPVLQQHVALARVRPDLAKPGSASSWSSRWTTITSRWRRTSRGCPSTARSARQPDGPMSMDRYDAIVIGAGHNGLVNGAYLARAGMKTLILERRHWSGARPSPRSCVPATGSTFSYALSLLRPQIIQELELTRHGFLPLLMSTRFAPGDDGEYLRFNRDHDETLREIARISPHDADAYEQYSHDLDRVCQAIKPLLDTVPPDPFSDDPEELLALAAVGSRLRGLDKRTLHNAVRLLTGSAADFLDDYFESPLLKGYLASSSIIGSKVGPRSQGSGLVRSSTPLGEHDGEFGTWAFHKGGNGGFTQVLARGGSVRRRDPAGGCRRASADPRGRGDRRALADGTEIAADVVVSALDPRRTFRAGRSARAARRPGRGHPPPEVPGRELEGELRPGCAALASGAGRNPGPVPRLHEHRPVDRLPGARLRRRQVRLVQRGSLHRLRHPVDPDMAPPGKHVLSCFVQYTPYRLRESDWDAEREPMADAPRRRWSASSRASATWSCSARCRHRWTSSARSACRRATSSPASSWRRRCSSSARRRAGRSTARRCTATTSAARARTRRLRDGRAGTPGGGPDPRRSPAGRVMVSLRGAFLRP